MIRGFVVRIAADTPLRQTLALREQSASSLRERYLRVFGEETSASTRSRGAAMEVDVVSNEVAAIAASTVDQQAVDWLRYALGLKASEAPFPWQLELLRRFRRGELVSALDIPTGLGKTAVMAVWLVARALGASLPRRLVYVVDRRAVVDQATEVAESLRAWVAQERAVADSLGLGDRPLPISTLRGQHVDNRAWLEDPSSPAIVVGTIDMVGSRLLFSGYGVSPKMRPYHAGLLGADTLVVLDEAHLVPAFEDLLRQVERGVDSFGPKDRSLRNLLPAFKLLSLSATGRQTGSTSLTLTDADRLDPIVSKRLTAKKTLTVVELAPVAETTDAEDGESRSAEAEGGANRKSKGPKLAGALAKQAWELTHQGSDNVRCLVFCDARKDAIAVAAELRNLAKSAVGATEPTIELFVGGRRVRERIDAREGLARLGFLAGTFVILKRSAFLIATSAGEVGVDLDADHMICDLIPWERMVQRLGRVNRRGDGDAKVIVVVESQPMPSDRVKQVLEKRDAAMRARQERSALHAKIDRLADNSPLNERRESEDSSSLRNKVQELDRQIAAAKSERNGIPKGRRSTPQDSARRETLQRDEWSLREQKTATSESLKKVEKDAKEQRKRDRENSFAPLKRALKQCHDRIKAFKDADAKVVARHEAEVEQHQALQKLLKMVGSDGGGLSPDALLKLRERKDLTEALRAATTVEKLRPELTRALIDAWSLTSLEEHPGRPEVDPWLRGFRPNDPPQTAVVWRRYLPVRADGQFDAKAAKLFFEAAPLHTSEQLETETHLVLDWLIARAKAVREAKVVEAPLNPKHVVAIAFGARGELRGWRTFEQLAAAKIQGEEGKTGREQAVKQLEEFLAGATLVIDAQIGGLTDGLLDGKAETLAVVADECSGNWLARPDAAGVPVTGFRIRELSAERQEDADMAWSTAPGEGWVRRHLFVMKVVDGKPSAVLAIDGWAGEAATEEERAEADRPQQLDEHQDWAAECAREIIKRLGLDKRYEDLVALSARLHDEGKRAPRWQRAFNAPIDGRPYAKTKGPIDFDDLDGYRHELGSLLYVEAHDEFKALGADDQDFVLHLIAAHHGFARPVIGTSGCDDAPPSIVDERARAVALRFARLSRRWGPWGLAWWEALMRAADQTASRRNQHAATARKERRG